MNHEDAACLYFLAEESVSDCYVPKGFLDTFLNDAIFCNDKGKALYRNLGEVEEAFQIALLQALSCASSSLPRVRMCIACACDHSIQQGSVLSFPFNMLSCCSGKLWPPVPTSTQWMDLELQPVNIWPAVWLTRRAARSRKVPLHTLVWHAW